MILENPQLDYLDIPKAETQAFIPHPIRFRKQQLLSGSVFLLILLVGPVLLFVSGNFWYGFTLLVLWLVLAIMRTVAVYKSFAIRGYSLRRHDISYRKGWLFFNVLTIPFNRIQHSEISQGPLDRMFKLSHLKIYTAGGSGADLTILGLDMEDAGKLRDFIAKEASQNE